MIADQNPGSDQGIVWAPFLGRDTAFINGPEKLATKYKLPVVFPGFHINTKWRIPTRVQNCFFRQRKHSTR
jgi:lauroyl/myristoyl acyltransferase